MKKENLILVLCFISMFILSMILVFTQSFLPTAKVDKMFNQKVNVVNETVITDKDYVNIRSHAEVMTLKNEKLADLYTVTVNHPVYFDMELLVGIDVNGKVYAIDNEVEAKDATSNGYLKLMREYLLKNYNGLYYPNVQYIDGAAGATTIGITRSMIKNAVSQVVVYHIGEPLDYIELLLGSDKYTLVSTNELENMIHYNVTLDNKTLNIYQITGEGTYYDYSSVNTGEITLYVAIDENNVITHASLPSDLYGHSGGSFYESSVEYLKSYIGLNIVTDLIDYEAQASEEGHAKGSKYLVGQLLNEVKEVVA